MHGRAGADSDVFRIQALVEHDRQEILSETHPLYIEAIKQLDTERMLKEVRLKLNMQAQQDTCERIFEGTRLGIWQDWKFDQRVLYHGIWRDLVHKDYRLLHENAEWKSRGVQFFLDRLYFID